MPRYLLHHAESDCLFEVFKYADVQHCIAEGCDNVTNLEKFERQFNKTKEKKMPRRQISRREAEPVLDQPLHIKYRPTRWDDVIGHIAVVKSLDALLSKSTRPHSYLFTGDSGIGKTTLARILASELKCEADNIIEIDAAVNTGVDDMRSMIDSIAYEGFGESPNKMYIIDECHMLSKQAWGSLLKATEEPPQHAFFVFCTTEESKVPNTMVTRCQSFNLKPLRYDDIMDLLEDVLVKENLGTSPNILKMVAKACHGSPRQALTMLANVANCYEENEAAALLEAPMESKEVILLCRMLLEKRLNWTTVQEMIKGMAEQSPESVRIVIVNYLNSCLLNAKSERDVPKLLDLLAVFSKPCNPTDKWAGILLAIGDHLFPA